MSRLKKELGLLDATMIGIGGTIGPGAFIIVGRSAGMIGPPVIIAWLSVGIVTLLCALNYSELASALPIAGGGYTFTKKAVGELPAFTTGWFMWLANCVYASFCAIGFAYLLRLVLQFGEGIVPFIATLTVAIFTMINYVGAKQAGRAQTLVTIILFVVIGLILSLGVFFTISNPEVLGRPFTLPSPSGFFRVVGYIWVTMMGFQIVATASEEIKNAERNVPLAMVITVLISTIIYTLIGFFSVYSKLPYETLAGSTVPLADMAGQYLGEFGIILVSLGGMVATLSSLNVAIMAAARVAYAMSRDDYLPDSFGKVHHHFGSPFVALAASSGIILAFCGSGVIDYVVYMSNFCYLVGMLIIIYSVIRLRNQEPDLARPFKVPWFPLSSLLAIGALLVILPFIEESALATGSGLIITAVIAYYGVMIGYERIRYALGGMDLLIGCLFIGASLLLPLGTTFRIYLAFFATVFSLAGVVYVTTTRERG